MFVWKLYTKKINGIHYITGSERKVKSVPDWILETPKPWFRDWVNKDGLYLWSVIPNPNFDNESPPSEDNKAYFFIENQQPPTKEVLDLQKKRELRQYLTTENLARILVAFRNGDNTEIDKLEKLMGESNI